MTCPQRNPISPGVAALRWSGSFRLDEVAGFLRIARQLCTGLGGRNHRNTQVKLVLVTMGVMVVTTGRFLEISPSPASRACAGHARFWLSSVPRYLSTLGNRR